LCSTKDAIVFFFAEKKRREEKKKSKKKNSSKERFKNPLKSLSPQIFRHSSLFWKNWISSPVRHNNKRLEDQNPHTTYNKKELSIISRSNKMMLMCVNCCVIHFSTFR
jgi:hypothetical protein